MKKILILILFLLLNTNVFADKKFEKDLKRVSKYNVFIDSEGNVYPIEDISNFLKKIF